MTQIRTITLAAFAFASALVLGTAPGDPGWAKTAPPSHVAAAQSQAQPGTIDVNSASQEELRTLPGIGRAYAKRIVQMRPYKSVEELRSRKVVPQRTYDMIRDKVVAKAK